MGQNDLKNSPLFSAFFKKFGDGFKSAGDGVSTMRATITKEVKAAESSVGDLKNVMDDVKNSARDFTNKKSANFPVFILPRFIGKIGIVQTRCPRWTRWIQKKQSRPCGPLGPSGPSKAFLHISTINLQQTFYICPPSPIKQRNLRIKNHSLFTQNT